MSWFKKIFTPKEEKKEDVPSQPIPSPTPLPSESSNIGPEPEFPPLPEDLPPPPIVEAEGWWSRMRRGLSKTSSKLTDSLSSALFNRKLDDETLEHLEEALISSDMGVDVSARVIKELGQERMGQDITLDEVKTFLANRIAQILAPVSRPLVVNTQLEPHVMLVVGVNGSAKTTTIGKFAQRYKEQAHKVRLVAGDTFRAAAVEQLQVWGKRAEVPVEAGPPNCDAAGLVYDALVKAEAEKEDVVLIDTAGRLQNKTDLMAELEKIVRVMKKINPAYPHDIILVLDATTGQNVHSQVETFQKMVGVTGLIMTKLDGTARGGAIVALAEKFGIAIHAIGVGEQAQDLQAFDPIEFSRDLLDIENK